jgi:hypothetical protein
MVQNIEEQEQDEITMQRLNVAGLAILALNLIACSKPPASKDATLSQPPAANSAATSQPAVAQPTATAPAVTPAAMTPAATAPPASAAGHAVKTEMRNVLFHFTDTAVAKIDTLSGDLLPTGKNEMPVFDDKTSFELRVANAKIAITAESLGEIMNTFIFEKASSPLKDVSVSINKDKLVIKGKLNNKGFIPFQTSGTLRATADGRLAIHTDKLKALHVPMKGMMNLFGVDLENVVNTSKIEGLEVDKDDLLMDLGKLLPPPHIIGKATAVSLENGSIVTIMGTLSKTPAPSAEKGGYMTFQGNPVRFGKIIMENADLTVLDLDPGDALDWNLDRYREQLVAGYSKITPNFGLRAYVKDFAKLPRSSGHATKAQQSSADAAPPKP